MLSDIESSMIKHARRSGWSIIEILIALAVFSVAISGLYIAMSSAQESLTTSMRRDMESAMVNTLVSEINPFNRLIESAYDQTTKQQLTLPDGGSVWYTRIVSSETATADRKDVNVYFYRNQSDTTPYRQFRREVSPNFIGYNCSNGSQPNYVKDSNGRIYTSITHNTPWIIGSRSNGFVFLAQASAASPAITGTSDSDLFSYNCSRSSGTGISFAFFGELGRKYNVIYGTYGAAGDDSVVVTINSSDTYTVDPVNEVGTNKALVKTFEATALDGGGGLGLILVGVDPSTAGAYRMTHIALEKAD